MTFRNLKSSSKKNSFKEGLLQTGADNLHSVTQKVTKPDASTVLLRRNGERKGKEGDRHVVLLLHVVPCGPCCTRPRYAHLGHNPCINKDATQLLLQYIRSWKQAYHHTNSGCKGHLKSSKVNPEYSLIFQLFLGVFLSLKWSIESVIPSGFLSHVLV